MMANTRRRRIGWLWPAMPALLAVLVMLFRSSVSAWRRIGLQGGQHPDAWLYASAVAISAPILLANIVNTTLSNAKVMSLLVLIYMMSFAAMRTDDYEYEEDLQAAGQWWQQEDSEQETVLAG